MKLAIYIAAANLIGWGLLGLGYLVAQNFGYDVAFGAFVGTALLSLLGAWIYAVAGE